MTNADRSVLFVDICDSTRLLESLGDVRGRAVLVSCLAQLRATAAEHHGTVLDEIGDELMVSFDDALLAARGACAMQVAVTNAVMAGILPPGVHVRIGFHQGPVVIHDGSLFGKTVHLARRVASVSKAQQIVLSRRTLDLLPSAAGIVTRFLDREHVKGHDEAFEMHEILWDDDLGTVVDAARPLPSQPCSRTRLLITFGHGTIELSAKRPVITVGRGENCDLVIERDNDKVSRLHGRLEFRKGGYFFVDASSNGSHVALWGSTPVFVRRDEIRLESTGTIALGAAADAPILRFAVLEERLGGG